MKANTPSLKCGGPTKKKKKKGFKDGTVSNVPVMSLTDLSKKFSEENNLVGDNKLKESSYAPAEKESNNGGNTGGDWVDKLFQAGDIAIKSSFDALKKEGDATGREDPSKTMKQNDTMDTLSGIFTGDLSGLLTGGKQKDERDQASKNWANSWSARTAAGMKASGYKKGGVIEGKGTAKSDSIPMKAKEGSFIVPAENAEYAEELGKTYLGWDKDEKAKRAKTGTDIKVSNGEVMFSPEEVNTLRYHGINLDELAPKATEKIGKKDGGKVPLKEIKKYPELKKNILVQSLKSGGPVMGFKKGTKDSDPIEESEWVHDKKTGLVINNKTKTAYDKSGAGYSFSQPLDDFGNPVGEGSYVKAESPSPYGMDIYSKTLGTTDDDKENAPDWMKYVPELAGALQVAGGAAGLVSAGKVPNLEVSRSLRKLSGEVRKLSEFGYEPKVINALNNEIENTRRNLTKVIENEGQNSGLEKMAKLNMLLTTTIDKKAGLAFANAAEKSRKWADVLKVDSIKAGQEFDINKIKVDDWYKNQEVFAGLVTAGISNIVGARQLKSEQDNLRKIGNSNPSFKA